MDVREFPAESSIISVHDDEGSISVHDDKIGPAAAIPSSYRKVWVTVSGFVKSTIRVVIFSIMLVIGGVVLVVCTVSAVLYGIYAFLLPEKVRYVVGKSLKYALAVVGSFLLLVVGVVVILLYPLAFMASRWKGIFILSCLAVSFDSLFLYIPIIDEEHNCLGTDMPLRNVALALRSVTDLTFIFHITCLICDLMNKCPKWSDSGLNRNPTRLSTSALKLKNVQEAMTKKISWLSLSVIINFVAILPFPQLAVIVGFFRMGSFYRSQIMNKVLIFQYFLRSWQIIISIKEMQTAGKWFKCASYFLLYFIASHVLGAFWYIFSIQLELSCWDEACQTIPGCMSMYDCGHNTSLNNIYMLSESCSTDTSNATTFDFGMYRDVLKSGNVGHTDFSAKFFYYFWWSLKNLSNFGTNLETSSDMWENCFAIIICAVGLLLFIILIGNVQTYIQSETENSMKIREDRTTRLNSKYKDIEKWMSFHGLPDERKNYFWKRINENKVVEFIKEDVDTEFFKRSYHRSYPAHKSDPLNFICVNALKKISILRNMDEQVLNAFCEYGHKRLDGQPEYITEEKDKCITVAGSPLDTLYLIIDGTIEDVKTKLRRDCCGEEVLHWAILNYKKSIAKDIDPPPKSTKEHRDPLPKSTDIDPPPKSTKEHRDPLPKSTKQVKCLTKIGAFKFTADQLINILKHLKNSEQLEEALGLAHDISNTDRGIKDWLLRNGLPEDLKANITNYLDQNKLLAEGNMDADVDVDILLGILPESIKPSIKRHLGMNALKKVAMLQKMHEYVLEIICNHLQPMVYKMNSYVVKTGEPLGFMIFILGGKVIFTDTSSSNVTTSSNEITEPSDENVLQAGGYYGEQLLSWASPNNISSSENPVISTRDVKCQTKVEALILKAGDLKSVASKCGSQWNFNNCMNSQQVVDDGRDRVANAAPTSTIEEAIRLHQGHDIILEQLVLIRQTIFQKLDDQGRRLDDQARKLDDQGRRLDHMASYLATVGYTRSTHTSSTPPAP